jgi:enoyl-CoA hydratase
MVPNVTSAANSPVQWRESGDNLIIKFTRPEIRSPLSIEALELIDQIVDRAVSNYHLKKLIFTGSGDTFASGANLNEIVALSSDEACEFALRGQDLMTKIEGCALVSVAAVNGFCYGGALDLALSCKRRIASPAATFSHPGVSLGIITGWGGTQRLPRLIGEAKALEMFLTAKRVGARESLTWGLIDEIADSPLEAALAGS